MTVNPFERPKRPQKPSPATDRPNRQPTQKPARPNLDRPRDRREGGGGDDRRGNGGRNGGGNGGDRRGGNGNGNGEPVPSPWLDPDNEPTPDSSASFVEYLRWMRSPDHPYKDPTKVQILQRAEESADYDRRLGILNRRTKAIAGEGNTFQVKCPWRIRVGGHRGPESILLPAFDALGMPYIPSSTLRGVARTQAIRHFMSKKGWSWEEAERHVAQWFGSLEVKQKEHRAGKVVFLDAYPLPGRVGLAVDIANNIWNWDAAGQDLKYSPNPNPFFSLREATFLIGIRPTAACDQELLEQVKKWLKAGLRSGIGSQVNTGYGVVLAAGAGDIPEGFFQVEFSLQGQLVHGRQKFTEWQWNDRRNEWQMRGQPDAEMRPIALKSMLRYWFRALALGVMPASEVRNREAELFGSISPKARGWVTVRLLHGKLVRREAQPNSRGKDEPCGEQSGTLSLSYSSEIPKDKQAVVAELFKNLTWMAFHLGGVGQGARRPCYSRKTRDRAPWWRGSTFITETEDEFWSLPDTPQAFQGLFRQRLQSFYNALGALGRLDPQAPLQAGLNTRDRWTEAVDANCQIVVCAGEEEFSKPYALAVLHSRELKVEDRQGKLDYDGNLCGKVGREVKPSPVWIADLGDYQLVTVFGSDRDPRRAYLRELRGEAAQFVKIFPMN